MEKFAKNINTVLSQVASMVNIGGTVSVPELEKRIQSAIGQLEEVQTNIDYLRKAHIPTIELKVVEVEEIPTKEEIIDAWEQHCRSTHQNFIPAVAVIMGQHEAEVRDNNGMKLGVYEYSKKKFK